MFSVCIIVKNEEENIDKCLQCLLSYDLEIIVVDTGSTDQTKMIAQKYTDYVYDFVWKNDFAAARNYAISKASSEFVMILDSDEFLEQIDFEKTESLMKQYPDSIGRIKVRNVFHTGNEAQESVEWGNRIFSKRKFHYTGKIHEQVTRMDGAEYDTCEVPVVIVHTGYDLTEEKRQEKAKRNIQLLEQELLYLQDVDEQVKNKEIPYLLYQLGKSYYMAKKYNRACEYFKKGLSYDLNPKLEYVIDMVETYGYALLNSNQTEEALNLENIYEEFSDSADFLFLMGLVYMNNSRFEEAIHEFLKCTKHTTCKVVGVNSYRAYYNVGVIFECLEEKEMALTYYQMCGDYKKAKEGLERIL